MSDTLSADRQLDLYQAVEIARVRSDNRYPNLVICPSYERILSHVNVETELAASGEKPAIPIEVRVENISQLFDTLDPFPFPERDLDRDAEEYITGWARELPRLQPITIVIHLPSSELAKHDAKTLAGAFNRYFEHRTGVVERELKEMFRVGRVALLIGLSVLAVCLTANQILAGRFGTTPLARFIEESLIILGWVANWKPIEIFLYDWWPLVRRRNLYRRLEAAAVQLKPYDRGRSAP